jgi:membrane protein DedA with SNARE-associated domain
LRDDADGHCEARAAPSSAEVSGVGARVAEEGRRVLGGVPASRRAPGRSGCLTPTSRAHEVGTRVAGRPDVEITDQLARHGAALVFANVLLQQLGVPIPAEPTLILAGALAAKGRVSPWRVVAATIVATTMADAVWFVLGRRYERRLARLFPSLSPSRDVGRATRWSRWGVRALLLARFVPGAVQLIVPLAGARQVKLASFLFYDLAGIVLWASLPVTGGMFFHREAEILLQALSAAAPWIGTAAVGAGALALWSRRRARSTAP